MRNQEPDVLELEVERIDEMREYCRNSRIGGEKDRRDLVVRNFETRGGSTTTRLGRLVVRPVDSCLGDIDVMGMNTGGFGSGNRGKRRHIDQIRPD